MVSEGSDVGTQLFAEGLVSKEKEIYIDKLCKCNVDCPYVLPKEIALTQFLRKRII